MQTLKSQTTTGGFIGAGGVWCKGITTLGLALFVASRGEIEKKIFWF